MVGKAVADGDIEVVEDVSAGINKVISAPLPSIVLLWDITAWGRRAPLIKRIVKPQSNDKDIALVAMRNYTNTQNEENICTSTRNTQHKWKINISYRATYHTIKTKTKLALASFGWSVVHRVQSQLVSGNLHCQKLYPWNWRESRMELTTVCFHTQNITVVQSV